MATKKKSKSSSSKGRKKKKSNKVQLFNPRKLRDKIFIYGDTQTSLAKRMGLSRQTVWQWLNGRREPTLTNVAALMVALRCEASDLLNKRRRLL